MYEAIYTLGFIYNDISKHAVIIRLIRPKTIVVSIINSSIINIINISIFRRFI